MSDEIRSKATKEAFTKYLEEHPEERFCQAIRNFAKVEFVMVGNPGTTLEDTFYREEE